MSYLRKMLKKSGSPNTGRPDLQDKSIKNNDLGSSGEEIAATRLKGMGFEIIGRNIRYKVGEIDLVAKRGKELHFIEVKTRTSIRFGDPIEFVTETKKKRIRKAAELFLLKSRNKFNDMSIPPCYFDVIGIDLSGDEPVVECIIDAFE